MEQHFTVWEIISLSLLLGSATYLLAASIQWFLMLRIDKRFRWKQIPYLFISQLFAMALAFLLWGFVFQNFETMYGFVFLPALISEIVVSTIVFKLAGYSVFQSKKT